MASKKEQYTDEELVKMIQAGGEGCEKALQYIYLKWYIHAKRILIKNSKINQVEDAINDGIIIFYKHIRNRKYQPTGKLKNYFISICQGCGYSNGRSLRRRTFIDDNDGLNQIEDEEVTQNKLLKGEVKIALDQMLKLLDRECRELLHLYMFSYSMKEIDVLLGIGCADKTRSKVHRCRKRLKNLIRKRPSLYDYLKRRNEE